MQALGIPTTRSLSLISLPDIQVLRERVESACIASRIAPSFIRIGSFEALNPPANVMLFGGGQQPAHYDALRTLGEWVGQRVLKLAHVEENKSAWGKQLVLEVTRRNAKMVAGWQAYGFMHGVINTDKCASHMSCYIPCSSISQRLNHGPDNRLWSDRRVPPHTVLISP
jgi:uncharacterized protein YdiU (UPF0061 family)